MATVDYTPPYELIKAILTGAAAPSGRERFWARLGPDAIEPLEELLNLALAYQQDHPPSLQEFLHWLRRREVETKRDMESVPDAVRILTVHGAKGLQAPIVILPDTIRVPRTADRLIWPAAPGSGAGGTAGGLPLIAPSDADADARTAAFKDDASEAQRQEYNRLLYVAMTRAQDALLICGSRGPRKIDDDCWHTLVERGLRRLEGTVEIEREGFDDPVLRYGSLVAAAESPLQAPGDTVAGPAHDPALLEALLAPPPPEAQPPRPLAPSRPAEDEPPVFGPFDAGADRFRRGALIHRLLQHLPDLPEAQRGRAAAQYLARPGHGLSEDEQREIAAEIDAVLDLPDARPLFGPGSMAEAPITGTIGGDDDRRPDRPSRRRRADGVRRRLQDQPAAAGRRRRDAAGLSAPDGRLPRPFAAPLPGAKGGLLPALDRRAAAHAAGRFPARSLRAGRRLSGGFGLICLSRPIRS